MADGLRVVHYLNQFFGGIGGEEKAFEGAQVKEGVVGPGKAVQDALKGRGTVVATIICGDDYFSEKTDEATQEIIRLLTPYRPDIVIAGPAFNAGRYGVACGAVCKAVQEKIGIPAVTGMYEENPGVGLYKRGLYIIRTADSARGMTEAISKMVNLAIKLANKEEIGRPSAEGYFAQGIFKAQASDRTAAQRAIDMLLAKLQGKPFETEVPLPEFEHIKPALMAKDLSSAKIALVTDGGLVVKGNPDHFTSGSHAKTGKYSIKGIDRLGSGDYEVAHGGYDSIAVLRDPHRLIPLDVMRDFEKEQVIGKLHDYFYATAGVGAPLEIAKKAGQDLAKELKGEGVDGVILTSTWGTSTRSGAAEVVELEKAGIPTAHVCTMTPVALMVGSSRIIPAAGITHPVGNMDLGPEAEKKLRRAIVGMALETLRTKLTEQKLFPRPA